MASFDQKAWDSSHGHRALPFQSKRDMNRSFSSPRLTGIKHSKELMEISFTNSSRVSPSESLFFSNKENVQSWLISTSPTPIFDFTAVERFVGDEAPILSPILSPSISSQISARHTPTELEDPETQRKHAWSGTNNPKESVNHLRMPYRFHDEGEGKLPSTSRRYGKDELLGPPDSPTGSTSSTGSEGRLLAFLAHKLLAYRGNSRRFSRYAREISGPIDEKHVMEDRSKKPAIDETIIETNTQSRSPPQEFGTNTLTAGGGLHRTTSEAVSELSLGSANNRTLSMEFDIMLAAAAAAASGMNQAPASEEQRHHQQQLPRIHEDSSIRFTGSDSSTRFTANEAGHGHDVGNHPSFQDGSPAPSPDADVSSSAMALAVTRQGSRSEEIDSNSTFSESAVFSRSPEGYSDRRSEEVELNNMQLVPTTLSVQPVSSEASDLLSCPDRASFAESSSSAPNRGNYRTATHFSLQASEHSGSGLSFSSRSSLSKEKHLTAPVIPPSKPLEKVRQDWVYAQAAAYQDAMNSKYSNRYKREESKITSWENQQKIKASLRMRKVEMKLEQKRAKALEKMENEIARARKLAEERKASAEAVRAMKTAKVCKEADTIRRTGRVPSTTIRVGCFPF